MPRVAAGLLTSSFKALFDPKGALVCGASTHLASLASSACTTSSRSRYRPRSSARISMVQGSRHPYGRRHRGPAQTMPSILSTANESARAEAAQPRRVKAASVTSAGDGEARRAASGRGTTRRARGTAWTRSRQHTGKPVRPGSSRRVIAVTSQSGNLVNIELCPHENRHQPRRVGGNAPWR